MKNSLIALVGIVLASQAAIAEQKPWTERISFSGDFRLRQDMIQKEKEEAGEKEDAKDRHRTRLRARFGFTANINEKLNTVVRLATAAPATDVNTTSTNETLDDGSRKKPIAVDLAYLDWKACPDTQITAGKMSNPFYTSGKNELIWDADMTPEGLAVKWSKEMDTIKPFANLSYWILDEQETESDVTMTGAQLGSTFSNLGAVNLTVGASYYGYNSAKGNPAFGAGAKGNTLNGANYANEYQLTEIFLEAGMDVGMPFTFYASYVTNSDPDEDETAYIAGIRLGKLKDVHSYFVDYSYRQTEKDALVGGFSDSDFAEGGTDNSGHKLAAGYQMAENTSLTLSLFMTEYQIADGHAVKDLAYNRALLDLMVNF